MTVNACSEGFVVGVDLGQARDFTAISIIEKVRVTEDLAVRDGFEAPRVARTERLEFHVRHLQRPPLGTTYPDVVDLVGVIMRALPEGSAGALLVDSTGVGRPVVDMMRKARLKPIAVTITGGADEIQKNGSEWRIPKRNLVTALAVLLQSGRLKISPELSEAEKLVQELINFKVKISASGADTYEAWRESIHDDLVLATAIAVWWGERKTSKFQVCQQNWMQR